MPSLPPLHVLHSAWLTLHKVHEAKFQWNVPLNHIVTSSTSDRRKRSCQIGGSEISPETEVRSVRRMYLRKWIVWMEYSASAQQQNNAGSSTFLFCLRTVMDGSDSKMKFT